MVNVRMTFWRRFWFGLCAVALTHSAVAQNYQGKELVRATILADTSAIVPGKPFAVGVLLRMAPDWHTYWKFSGDAGLPTEIKWNLAPGWKVGEIQWPIPLKTNDPGDIQTYGYQDEVMLIQEITPPSTIDNSPVKLSAQVDWLVCERICIPGGATLTLELPTKTSAEPKNTDLFARYRRLLPQKFPDANTASVTWSRTGNNLHLKVTGDQIANYQAIDFFPVSQSNDIIVGHPSVESPDKSLSSMPGLIVFAQHENGNDRQGWEISPAQTVPAAKIPQSTPSPIESSIRTE